MTIRTQVGIVGAGPSGLLLAKLLQMASIESVIIENRSREYCEARVRAGLMEQWARDLLVEIGLGERMLREGMYHEGIKLRFGDGPNGGLHPIEFTKLVGKGTTIYGQQEVVKDFNEHLINSGIRILFEVEDTSVHDLDGKKPRIRFRHDGKSEEIECDFIGGCDGFHGICRPSIPESALQFFDREYPFGWLGILTDSPPPDHELIYSYTERGFALYTMRSPTVSRLYLQVDPGEDINNWSDARIWEELHTRLQGARKLQEGPIVQKGITPMRSFVTEPMQYGRLFLAGDSAHIVPPTGAKGMNLAFADVRVLARAFIGYYKNGGTDLLDGYSQAVLPRVWKAQRFSWWMTQLLHRFPHENAFDQRRQLAELDYVATSKAASTTLAENYAGLPID